MDFMVQSYDKNGSEQLKEPGLFHCVHTCSRFVHDIGGSTITCSSHDLEGLESGGV